MDQLKLKIETFVKAVWQQVVLAVVAAVAAYLVLAYVIANLFDVKMFNAALAIAVGILVYQRASLSKLKNAISEAQDKVKSVLP
jgi:Kef-type K+ transport system membrane component KefB